MRLASSSHHHHPITSPPQSAPGSRDFPPRVTSEDPGRPAESRWDSERADRSQRDAGSAPFHRDVGRAPIKAGDVRRSGARRHAPCTMTRPRPEHRCLQLHFHPIFTSRGSTKSSIGFQVARQYAPEHRQRESGEELYGRIRHRLYSLQKGPP